MANVSAIQKQKEDLQRKLQVLVEKEKLATATEKKALAEAGKKNLERNKSALAEILFKLHGNGFKSFDLEALKSEVSAILSPVKKEKVKVAKVKSNEIVKVDPVVASVISEVGEVAETE